MLDLNNYLKQVVVVPSCEISIDSGDSLLNLFRGSLVDLDRYEDSADFEDFMHYKKGGACPRWF